MYSVLSFQKISHFIFISYEIYLEFHQIIANIEFPSYSITVYLIFSAKIKMNCIKFPFQLITTWTLARNASFGWCDVFSSRNRSAIHKFKVRFLKFSPLRQKRKSAQNSLHRIFRKTCVVGSIAWILNTPQKWIANGEEW